MLIFFLSLISLSWCLTILVPVMEVVVVVAEMEEVNLDVF